MNYSSGGSVHLEENLLMRRVTKGQFFRTQLTISKNISDGKRQEGDVRT